MPRIIKNHLGKSLMILIVGAVFITGFLFFKNFSVTEENYSVHSTVSNRGNIFYNQAASVPTGILAFRTYDPPLAAGSPLTSVIVSPANNTFVKTLAAPTRDEKIAVNLKDDEQMNVLLCTGDCNATADWSLSTTVDAISGDGTIYRTFDVAYEQLSGRAMVAWGQATMGYIYYSLWDGNSWSAVASYQFDVIGGGFPRWIRLVPRGDRFNATRTDEILLGIADANSNLYVARWDGDSWEDSNNVINNLSSIAGQAFDLAWENLSGNALVIFSSSGASFWYKKYTPGSGWGGLNLIVNATRPVTWAEAASNPTGNQISVVTVEDASDDAMSFIWTGSSWSTGPEDDKIDNSAGKQVATAWSRFSGRAIFLWTDFNALTSDMVCWTSGGFSSVMSDVGGNPEKNSDDVEDMVLVASPNNDRMLLTRHDIDDNLLGLTYDGTGCADDDWTALDAGILNTGVEGLTGSGTARLAHSSAYNPYMPWSHNWQWFDDEANETPSTALANESTTSTDIASGNKIRLRLSIIEPAGQGQENIRKKLQFATSTGACLNPNSCSNWVDVDTQAGGDYWRYCDGGGADDAAVTAYNLTAPASPLSTTRQYGPHVENGTAASTFDHNATTTAEFDYCIENNGAAANTTYYFRAWDNEHSSPILRYQASYPATPCYNGASSIACTYPSLTTAAGAAISIIRTTDGSVVYGTVKLGDATSTDIGVGGNGTVDPEAFKNNGTAAELFKIYSTGTSGGATEWTLGDPSPAANVFVHSFATTTAPVSYWQVLGTALQYETASSSVAVNGEVIFYFRIDMPTDADNYTKTITLNIMAEAAP